MAIAGYDKDLLLTIDSSKIDSTLTDFPVLVELDSTMIDFSDCQSAGQDIRFGALATGTYDYEIENWDATAETARIWVKIPSVSSSSDTVFYMHYSNSGASDGQDAAGTWDNDYIVVCHMKELALVDSSGNNSAGSSTNMASTNIVDGKVYKGLDYNGTDEYSQFADDAVLDLTDDITLEVSINVGSFQSASPYIRGIVSKSIFGADAYLLRFGDKTFDRTKLQWVVDGNKLEGTYSYSTGTWYNIAASYDRTTQRLYRAGVQESSRAETDAMGVNTDPLLIGRSFTAAGNRFFDGIIDEVRISSVARTAAWLKASSYSTDDDLLTYGGEDVSPNFFMFFN